MNEIHLFLQNGAYFVTFEGPIAAKVQRLFGTPTIRTPYLESYGGFFTVANEIQAKNPDCEVYYDIFNR